MIQGRDPQWVNQIFFARYDPEATWFDDLVPAFGARRFFFKTRFSQITSKALLLDRFDTGEQPLAGWTVPETVAYRDGEAGRCRRGLGT
jgi:hypothetical protein